jgi:two-component sensor histidine kinase
MQIDNADTQEVFNEMQRRILAISSIHQKLYSGDSVSLINMKDYLGEVVESIHMAFNNNKIDVGYEIAIQNVKLDIDAAVSIGLIVNELTTNAYKYAFKPNRENMLVLTLIQNKQNNIELTFKDNGNGMQKNFDIEATESLGLRMVNLLTRQQKGTLEYKNDNGAMFSILFRKNNK